MNFAPSIQNDILNQPDFPHISKSIIKRTGLAYYDNHLKDLAKSVSIRMSRVNLHSLNDYATRLDDSEHAFNEIDELAKLLTIGETHFFRHRKLMDALRRDVLPDLIHHKRKSKQLRIWSAGCSIGAEPYTLAIILRKYFGAKISDWHISILGTDINRDFLELAAQGRYSEWALRGIDEEILHSCFNYNDSRWNINNIYKQDVQFQYHNLATDLPPIASEHDGYFDLILCRNVFIYFDSTTIQNIVSRFSGCLVDKGYLAIGHSEMNVVRFSEFTRDIRSNAPIYQNLEAVDQRREHIPLQMPLHKVKASKSYVPAHTHKLRNTNSNPLNDRFAEVDHCANLGDLDQAIELCKQVIANHRFDPNAYLRQAMLFQEQGYLDKAENAARQAVYLDRSSPLAHYYHGTISQQQGNSKNACKSFLTVMDLLKTLDKATIIDTKSGMTVDDLLRIVPLHMHKDSSI